MNKVKAIKAKRTLKQMRMRKKSKGNHRYR